MRELIGPLYNRTGWAGRDPIAAIAAQAGINGPKSMGGKILLGAETIRGIFADLSGSDVRSIDYTEQKVDTSFNVKRDWMAVGGEANADLSWQRLAAMVDVVGAQSLTMMVRFAVFFEPLLSVAISIEDDEAALATGSPRVATLEAAGTMVRVGSNV